MVAANEILLDTNIFGEDGRIVLESPDDEMWSASKQLILEINTYTSPIEQYWHNYRNQGILIMPNDGIEVKNLKAHDVKQDSMSLQSMVDRIPNLRSGTFDPITEFGIHSTKLSVAYSVLAIRNIVKELDSTKKVFSNETISVRFPVYFFLKSKFESIIHKTPHISGYVHTGNSSGYYLGGDNASLHAHPTIIGSFSNVLNFLSALNFSSTHNNSNALSLRVTAPSQDTLQKVIDATWSCKDNPGTLGCDFNSNAYFAVKSKDDMVRILQVLATGDRIIDRNEKPLFKLIQLHNPKGIF